MKNLNRKAIFLAITLLIIALCFGGCSLLNFGASIWVDTSLAKTEIEQGEEFDYSTLVVYLEKMSGCTQIDNSLVTFGKVDNTTIGTQRISVEYDGLKAFFSVTVKKPSNGVVILDATTLPTKCLLGSDVDFSAIKGSIIYDGKQIDLQGNQFTFEGFDKTQEGDQTIRMTFTHNYKTYIADFTITVYQEIRELRVDLTAMKNTYQYFEFDWSAICVYFYDCGNVTNLNYGDFAHTEIDVMTAGKQNVTLSYNGYETSFEIEVLASTAYLDLDLTEVKTVVLLNESFDISKLKITFYIAVGEQGVNVPLDDLELEISSVDTSTIGEVTVVVTYKTRFTTSFVVRVADKYTVTFSYINNGVPTQESVNVEKNGTVQPLSHVITTDDLFFIGWYKAGASEPYDFNEAITNDIALQAKYATKQEYIANLIEKMQEQIDQYILTKTGKANFRLTYLESDYVYLLELKKEYSAKLTLDKTWQQLDDLLKGFSEDFVLETYKLKTALERVEEYKNSLDFSLLNDSSKASVEKLFAWAIEMMTDYDGGAPNLDYIFYQLQLQVSFYFDV